MKRIITFLALVVFLADLVGAGAPTMAAAKLTGLPAGVKEAKVAGYNDGDKIEVAFSGKNYEVNLVGEDAPEPGECYAKEASAYIKKLLKKKQVVYLESDATDKDGKGRLLRYVWAADSKGAKAYLVNERLIAKGYASFKSKDKNTKYDARLAKAQDSANQQLTGLWLHCGGPHTEIIPTPVYTTEESKYLDAIGTIESGVAQASDNLGKDTQPDTVHDQAWLIRVVGSFALFQVEYQEIQKLTPPAAFADAHATMTQGLAILDSAATDFTAAGDAGDSAGVAAALVEYYDGAEQFIQGYAAVLVIKHQREGDG